MLSQQGIFSLIQQLGGSRNNIIVNTTFIDVCGSHNAAMMLAQLLYWAPMAKIEGGWIAKEKADWYNELRLTPYQCRQAEERLVELGILTYENRKFRGVPTGHYLLNSDGLVNAFVKFLNIGKSSFFTSESQVSSLSENEVTSLPNVKKVEFPYTEITSENTSENTADSFSGLRREVKNQATESSQTQAPQTGGARRGRPARAEAEVCPVFIPARDSFVEAYLARVGAPYRFNGAKDAVALKATLVYLRSIVEGNSWEEALGLFNAILQGWAAMPKWMQPNGNFNLSFINSQINGIVAAIRDTISGANTNKLTPADLM